MLDRTEKFFVRLLTTLPYKVTVIMKTSSNPEPVNKLLRIHRNTPPTDPS